MRPPLLLLRATASVEIGTGHVLRVLALAQAWREIPARVVLATPACPPALVERLTREGIEIASLAADDDAAEFRRLVESLAPAWVVWDGYHFSAAYFQALHATGARGLLIDDFPRHHPLPVEVVVNYNFAARPGDYPQTAGETDFLLGPAYFPLRKEFWRHRRCLRTVREAASRILITMGGADAENVTQQVLEEFKNLELPPLEVVVVLGGANPHQSAIRSLASGSRHQLRIETNVADMPALMQWADVAISAAGITAWEMCFMQLPALLVQTADNQSTNARTLSAAGVAIFLDGKKDTLRETLPTLLASPARRAQMAMTGAQLVDGEGVFRLRETMLRRGGVSAALHESTSNLVGG